MLGSIWSVEFPNKESNKMDWFGLAKKKVQRLGEKNVC